MFKLVTGALQPSKVITMVQVTKLWQTKSFLFSSMFEQSIGPFGTHNPHPSREAGAWELALFEIAILALSLNYYVFYRHYACSGYQWEDMGSERRLTFMPLRMRSSFESSSKLGSQAFFPLNWQFRGMKEVLN